MLSTVCCSFAYSGTSWKGETGVPSFSMKARNSSVLGAPILRTLNSAGCLPYDILSDDGGADERCREMWSARRDAMLLEWSDLRVEFLIVGGASVGEDAAVTEFRGPR
jgi:hypothetical protein